MKIGSKALIVLLLFVGLVLVNYLASSLPVRIDSTEENIYTLSSGTKSLLRKIEEPITVDLYVSQHASGLSIAYKNYAARVEEMLRQYVRASRGKLTLNVIDPRPDTPDEEKATAAGLAPQMLQTGEQIVFGLVVTQADQQKNIPALNPQREQFLEYDISQLISSVQQLDKKKMGLITSLPLQSPDQMPMMRQPSQPGQFVANEWERSFEIVKIELTASELPAGLDALAVIHPQNLSSKLQFAIDQFILGGKPTLLAVDPSSQHFKRQGSQMGFSSGQQPNISSDAKSFFEAYGITYKSDMVVGDLENATPLRDPRGGPPVRYPTWLNLNRTNFNSSSMATAQLNSLLFVESGSIAKKSDSTLTFTPLIETSAQSGELSAMALQFSSGEDVGRQITPSGKKTIAALVTGKFKSAFPDGPAEEKPAEGDKTKDQGKAEEPKPSGLKESKDSSTLLIVADTDFLFDDFSVRKYNFFGQTAAEPLNDNLAFAANSLEFLGGSQDLISIRGKGSSMRPFDVVRNMEVAANKKYQEKLTALEARLNQVQTKLNELQGKKTEGNRLIATPEVAKAIEDFQKQQAALQGERRGIRRALREDINSLETRLLLLNLLATPLLVGVFGFWFYNARKK